MRNEELEIYPNPTAGIFTVSTEGVKAKEIKVMNVVGKEIMKEKINGGSATMDMSRFGKWIYFVEVRTEKGVAYRKVIIE